MVYIAWWAVYHSAVSEKLISFLHTSWGESWIRKCESAHSRLFSLVGSYLVHEPDLASLPHISTSFERSQSRKSNFATWPDPAVAPYRAERCYVMEGKNCIDKEFCCWSNGLISIWVTYLVWFCYQHHNHSSWLPEMTSQKGKRTGTTSWSECDKRSEKCALYSRWSKNLLIKWFAWTNAGRSNFFVSKELLNLWVWLLIFFNYHQQNSIYFII